METDGRDSSHNFARLRIDHLDYLGYCSFFTRFASVSSYDAACSCSASFQLFTRLLDLRLVMRLLLVPFRLPLAMVFFSPAVGYALSRRLAPAPGRPPWTSKSRPQHTAGSHAWSSPHSGFTSLPMNTNRHSRPSPSCHVSTRGVGPPHHIWRKFVRKWQVGRLDRRTSPCNPWLSRLPWYPNNWVPYPCIKELIRACNSLAFNSRPGKLHDNRRDSVVMHKVSPIGLQEIGFFSQHFLREDWHVQQCLRINLAEIGPDVGARVDWYYPRGQGVESRPYLLHRQCRFDLRDTLATFRRTPHQGQFSPFVALSLEPSSEQQLTLVQNDSAGRGQLFNRLVLGSFELLCLSVDNPQFLNLIFWLLVPRVTQGLVGACCGLLVLLMAIHESLCVVARLRPSWSLRAVLIQSRSHVHLSSVLWIHVVCSDCSVLLHTAQIPAETLVAWFTGLCQTSSTYMIHQC